MPRTTTGKDALKALAKRFPQLYVAPAKGAQDSHKLAATLGIAPKDANLNHFISSDEDELRTVDTPAGPIEVLFLKNRADFETFLQIIGHKSQPVEIARTIGAITYKGLADWDAVTTAHANYLENGGSDWTAEFARLAKQQGAFRAEIIVISEGPYSNVPAQKTPYNEKEWVQVSRSIRLFHECAHVVCRRSRPTDILPVWDEITADATGLLCAAGKYDAGLAGLFLGVDSKEFSEGRLSEYLDDNQKANINEISREINVALKQIEELSSKRDNTGPFEFLIELKNSPIIRY